MHLCAAQNIAGSLRDKLDNTTGLLDLLFGVFTEVSRTDNEWDLWETALAENLAIAKREEVEDGCRI
jgi:hypothetical protein